MILEKVNNILSLHDFESLNNLSFENFDIKDYKQVVTEYANKINKSDLSLTSVHRFTQFINIIHEKQIFNDSLEDFHFHTLLNVLNIIPDKKETSTYTFLMQIRHLVVDCLSSVLSVEKLNFYHQETEQSILKFVLKSYLNAPFIPLLKNKGLDFTHIEGQNPYYYALKHSDSTNVVVEYLYHLNIPLPSHYWAFVFKEISAKRIPAERDFLLSLPQETFIVDETTNECVWNIIIKDKSYFLIDYLPDHLYKPHTSDKKNLFDLMIELNDFTLISKLGIKILKLLNSEEELVHLFNYLLKNKENRALFISEFLDKLIDCGSRTKHNQNTVFLELKTEWNHATSYSILNPLSLLASLITHELVKNKEITSDTVESYKKELLSLDNIIKFYKTRRDFPTHIRQSLKNYLDSLKGYSESAPKQNDDVLAQHTATVDRVNFCLSYKDIETSISDYIFEDSLSYLEESTFSCLCEEAYNHVKSFKFPDMTKLHDIVFEATQSSINIFSTSAPLSDTLSQDINDDEVINVFLSESEMAKNIVKIEKLAGATDNEAKESVSHILKDLKAISNYPSRTPNSIHQNTFLSLLTIFDNELNEAQKALLVTVENNLNHPAPETSPPDTPVPNNENATPVEKPIVIELFSTETFTKFKKENEGGNSEVLNTFFKKSGSYLQYQSKTLATASHFLQNIDKLYETFPHFEHVIKHIENFMVLQDKGDKSFYIPPLLLGGGPGVGKTFFCHTVSKLINTHFELLNMESMTANWILTGASAQWRDAMPGKIFTSLFNKDYQNMNPIFLLDELEKAGDDSRFGVMNSLLPLLERYTAKKFKDECIPLEIDASYIVWFATANDLDKLSAPIRSRFDILSVPNPTPTQRKSLIKGIYETVRNNNTWGHYFDELLPDESLDILANLMAPGAARDLRKSLTMACSKAIREESKIILPHHIERYENGETMPWDIVL